ncbi:MAG: FHA domain-containing protein [Thermoanaerobaculia bacterium]
MPAIPCPTCGAPVAVDERAEERTWVTIRCAACGERIRYCVGSPATTARLVFDAPIEYPPGTRPGELGEDAFSTLFHPRSALRYDPEDAAEDPASDGTVRADAEDVRPPDLPSDEPVGFLVLGARPGSERVRLTSARTVFGRQGADVDLDDAAVSRRHFQVEAAGSEFFIRDLDSSNGTWVNGRRIRYTELADGDEVRAGRTFLVFRLLSGA